MKKVLIFIFITLNLYASEFKIDAIESGSGTIECSDVKVGESGLIVRNLENFNSIIANAIVTKIENNKCSINFQNFESLNQEALPSLKESPKVGDIVIFKSLNKRALAITSNLKNYEEVTKESSINWIHPDIFATYLESEANPSPTKENFVKFCNAYSIGLIYFALDKEYIVDCTSFKILETKEFETKEGENIKPFYSRVGELKASIFNFKDEIKNYINYYKKLLGL